MNEKTRAYWRHWWTAPVAIVVLVAGPFFFGSLVGPAYVVTSAIVGVAIVFLAWLAWVVDDDGRTDRLNARIRRWRS